MMGSMMSRKCKLIERLAETLQEFQDICEEFDYIEIEMVRLPDERSIKVELLKKM